MALRDELMAETGAETHIAHLCERAANGLLIKDMKIEQQRREIERLQIRVKGYRNEVMRAFAYVRDARPSGYEAAIVAVEAVLEDALKELG